MAPSSSAGALVVLILFPIATVAAQAPRRDSPNSIRPPLITYNDDSGATEAVSGLILRTIRQSVEQADTVSLLSLIPDSAIAQGEVIAAQLRGCSSLGQALIAASGRRRGSGPPIRLEVPNTRPDLRSTADTVAMWEVRLASNADTSPSIEVNFVKSGEAIRIGRISGFLAALCASGR